MQSFTSLDTKSKFSHLLHLEAQEEEEKSHAPGIKIRHWHPGISNNSSAVQKDVVNARACNMFSRFPVLQKGNEKILDWILEA